MGITLPLLGAGIAILSGLLGLYRFQENWLEYRTVCESLKQEKYLFLTRSEPYHDKNPLGLLVNKVETLISKENTNWSQYMMLKTHLRQLLEIRDPNDRTFLEQTIHLGYFDDFKKQAESFIIGGSYPYFPKRNQAYHQRPIQYR